MSVAAAIVASALLTALAVLQICVASGAPLGRFVWGGQHRVLPRRLRVGRAVSVPLYAAFALVLLSRCGVLPGGSSSVVHVATWTLVGYFTLGIFLNLASRSAAERRTMAPASALLAITTLIVALA